MSTGHAAAGERPVRIGVELTPDRPVPEIVKLAESAEAGGIDVIFVSNHYNNRDPFVTLAAAAEATDRVALGPGVVNPYEAHPVRLASSTAALDELSGGRAIFGLGAGDRSTLDALGLERDRPVRRVRETIDVARRLWAGEQVDHDGTFQATAAALNYPSRTIPVYVGAQGPVMLRMSAEYADGVLVNAAHPRDYRWSADQLADGLADRSDAQGPLTVAGFASVSVADDTARARHAARKPVAFITAGAPDGVIGRHGLADDRVGEIQTALSSGERDRAYDLVTDAMIDAFCVAGTPATVRERLLELLEYADAVVAASPLGPDRSAAVGHLGEIADGLRTEGVSS